MAFSAVLNRSLKTVPPQIVVFYHGFGGMIISIFYILIEWCVVGGGLRLVSYTGRIYLIAFGASLLHVTCLYSFTIAYASDSSGFVALLSYVRIFWAYTADIVIFDEQLKTSQVIAALVIIIVAVSVAIYKLKSAKKDAGLKG